MVAVVACPVPVLQFFDNTGNPAAGGSLLTQVGGVNYITYSDSGGVTALPNPIPLNSRGEVSTAAGVSSQLFLVANIVYTFTLYDAYGNQVWVQKYVDGIQLTTVDSINITYDITPAETLAGLTVFVKQFLPGDVRRYGGDSSGVIDSTAAWNSAILQAQQIGGAEITAPGIYLAGNLSLTNDGVLIRGSGIRPTIINANANGVNILKIAASYCGIKNLQFNGNGFTGVSGLVFGPVNEAATTGNTQANFNAITEVEILNCAEGLRLTLGASPSGTYYNNFRAVWIRDCIRGIWLQNGVSTSAGGSNRNTFFGVRIGSSSNVCNTGLQIDSGDTNTFYGIAMEGMNNGTSPNATPIAIKIAAGGTNTSGNDNNRFFGATSEACTVSLENHNTYSSFWGCQLITAPVWSVIPLVFHGGYDISQTPEVFPGFLYQGNNEFPAYPNVTNCLTSANGAVIETTGLYSFRTETNTGWGRPSAGILRGQALGSPAIDITQNQIRNISQTAGTGPGGSSTAFNFANSYLAGVIYLVVRGANDVTGANYSHRASLFFETVSGTFVEAASRILDLQGGGTSVNTDTVTRSGGNVVVTVNIAKSAISFINYATIQRLT